MAAVLLSTSSSGLSGQYQKYFDKKLLTAVLQLLVMDQLAQVRSLPPGQGSKIVTFTRPDSPDRTQVQSLSEGVPLANDRDYTFSFVDVSCAQVGERMRISDILSATNLFDTLERSSVLLGQEAAHYYDFAITQALVNDGPSGSPGSGYFVRQYAAGAADFATVAALPPNDGKLTIVELLKAMTRLTLARAPKASANDRAPKARGGDYIAVLPPQVLFDVMQDPKFIDAGVRGQNDGLFNGEVGTWYGVRIMKGTQPWLENAEGTYNSAGAVASSIVTGSEGFGVVNLASQSIASPKLIVVNSPDKTDALNQLTIVGWKAYFGVKVLKTTWGVVIKSLTTYA